MSILNWKSFIQSYIKDTEILLEMNTSFLKGLFFPQIVKKYFHHIEFPNDS